MKNETLRFRVSEQEKEAFQLAAEISGVALSAWIRERLRRSVCRELIEAGKKVPFLQERLDTDGE